jgi:hypothetical protein
MIDANLKDKKHSSYIDAKNEMGLALEFENITEHSYT